MRTIKLGTLISELRQIPDPRQAWKVKHTLYEILLLSIIAVIANANSSYEIYVFAANRREWLSQFLPLANGIPSRLTIERVLRVVNPKHFNEALSQIMQHVQAVSNGAIVALDGKAFHATHEGRSSEVLYMVNAWCSSNGLTLGQVETSGKGNEITTIPKVLKLLNVSGATITINAIGCQHAIVKQIVKENKADYAIALKENQSTMYHEFKLYAEDYLAHTDSTVSVQYHKTIEKGHGRIEMREYYLFDDLF